MKKIAVLMGGPSPEYEVSLRSGENVARNLDRKRFATSEIVVGRDGRFSTPLKSLRKLDVAFVAMHGPFGEDGTIQAILERIGLPYTGSGVGASCLAMDKIASKLLFVQHHIPTPDFRVVEDRDHLKEAVAKFGFPLVVKPSNQGSSVGVSIARDSVGIEEAYSNASSFGPVIAERFIRGREIQAGILGREMLPLVEIIPKREFFDFEAKYTPGLAEEITPAHLNRRVTTRIQALARRAFDTLGCRHFGRVDLFLSDGGEILVSEVNTIPGLTENSLFPKEAQAAGIPFPKLLERIIGLALKDDS